MKLKLRIIVILGTCVLMVIGLGLYFTFSQLDFQKSERQLLIKLHHIQKLKEYTSISNSVVSEATSPKNLTISSVATVAGMKINSKLMHLNFTANKKSRDFLSILSPIQNDIKFNLELNVSPWSIAAGWVKPQEIHPESAPELGFVLNALSMNSIVYAGIGYKGTQLKMMLKLNGGQEVIFKPMRYERDFVVTGSPYAGADRHNGEIAAFHLNRLLGFCRTPVVVGRAVNLKTEIQPVASETLKKTFFTKENSTCFYGHCYYCSPADPACGKGDIMEGAIILMLPGKYHLKKFRNPWQRTYKDNVSARWEHNFEYCEQVLRIKIFQKGRRLLDLIDAAIFDYLIGNADRHHYEVFADFPESAVILLDNGKSFGNPYWDELTILAPLYQCCKVRRKTFERLWIFASHLGYSMKELLMLDHLAPVLSQPHFDSLDRRLKTVLAAIEVCIEENGDDNVLVEIL